MSPFPIDFVLRIVYLFRAPTRVSWIRHRPFVFSDAARIPPYSSCRVQLLTFPFPNFFSLIFPSPYLLGRRVNPGFLPLFLPWPPPFSPTTNPRIYSWGWNSFLHLWGFLFPFSSWFPTGLVFFVAPFLALTPRKGWLFHFLFH